MPVSAIPFRPVSPYFPCRPCSKSFSLVQFSSAKPFHFVGFFHRRGPRIMTDLVNTSAFRSNDGDEGFFSVEKEAILGNELSEFRSSFISGGFEATLNRLSKWLVFALFGAFILLRHDIEALWAAMGSVINAWLSITIKRILNQERPVSTLRSGPGMPSSHAQTIFFAVIFAILSLLEWLGINGFTIIAGVFVLACGSYFSKWLVFALFGAFILLRHDTEALWAAMGFDINAWLSITIKRILNQERPVSTLRSDPGMPSSHAQTIFFTVIFAILSLVEWLGINGFTIIVGVFVLACGSYFIFYTGILFCRQCRSGARESRRRR